MGQAKEQLGGLPMPHEVMGDSLGRKDSLGRVERMAGSAFDAEKPSGLEKQVGSKYSGSSPSKLSRSKYLSESGRQSFGS